MRRILVFGSSGAGKSTFSRDIGAALHLPVLHLDAIWYGPDWTPGDPDRFAAAIEAATTADRWVIDGNFADFALAARLARADLAVLLDQPLAVRLWRAAWRGIVGRPRPDLPAGCRDGLDPAMFADILAFDRRDRPALEAAVARRAPTLPLLAPRGDAAIAGVLRRLANHPS
jgi:adenylate kinase family enzyme